MDDILGNNDHVYYARLFHDTHPVYPLRKNRQLTGFLAQLKQFVCKKSNYLFPDDIIETFRNSFVDFVFVFSYYHEIMHMESSYIETIKTKIINDNPRFLNMFNMENINYLMHFITTINDNNNRYTEFFFNKEQTCYRMHDNGNCFRLYSTLVNWNNNPLFNKDTKNLNMFKLLED